MNKIILDIFVPATGKHIEMKVSPKLKIIEVITMLREYINKQGFNEYVVSEGARLCDYKTGKIYNINVFISELRLGNGANMMLI